MLKDVFFNYGGRNFVICDYDEKSRESILNAIEYVHDLVTDRVILEASLGDEYAVGYLRHINDILYDLRDHL